MRTLRINQAIAILAIMCGVESIGLAHAEDEDFDFSGLGNEGAPATFVLKFPHSIGTPVFTHDRKSFGTAQARWSEFKNGSLSCDVVLFGNGEEVPSLKTGPSYRAEVLYQRQDSILHPGGRGDLSIEFSDASSHGSIHCQRDDGNTTSIRMSEVRGAFPASGFSMKRSSLEYAYLGLSNKFHEMSEKLQGLVTPSDGQKSDTRVKSETEHPGEAAPTAPQAAGRTAGSAP